MKPIIVWAICWALVAIAWAAFGFYIMIAIAAS